MEKGTQKGIEAVEVWIRNGIAAIARPSQIMVTNIEGRFSAWLPPGMVNLYVPRVPVEYQPPAVNNVRDFGETPLVELERATTIEGIVVDEDRNPVPSAWLNIQFPGLRRMWKQPPERADASGRFTVEQLPPSDALILRARSPTAASQGPVTVVPSESTAR